MAIDETRHDADPVVCDAYRRDSERGLREVAIAAERCPQLRGLSPGSAVNLLAYLLDQALDGNRGAAIAGPADSVAGGPEGSADRQA